MRRLRLRTRRFTARQSMACQSAGPSAQDCSVVHLSAPRLASLQRTSGRFTCPASALFRAGHLRLGRPYPTGYAGSLAVWQSHRISRAFRRLALASLRHPVPAGEFDFPCRRLAAAGSTSPAHGPHRGYARQSIGENRPGRTPPPAPEPWCLNGRGGSAPRPTAHPPTSATYGDHR